MRGAAMVRAVTLGGLGALGDVNLCTDTGWVAAQSLIGGGFDILGAGLAPTTSKKTGETGGGAGYTAAQVGSTLADSWGAACAAERARNAQEASAANTRMMADQMAADRQMQERMIAEQRRSSEQQLAMMMQMGQRPPPAAPAGIDRNTLLIGGGILAAAVLGIVLLR